MDSQEDNFFHLFNIFISIRSNIEKKYVNACESVYRHYWKKLISHRRKIRTKKLNISSKILFRKVFLCIFDDFFGTVLNSTFPSGPGPMETPPELPPPQKSPRLASSLSVTCLLIKPDTPKHKIKALPEKCMCSFEACLRPPQGKAMNLHRWNTDSLPHTKDCTGKTLLLQLYCIFA